ncbi:MAG TPA: potassium transporter TrkH [Acinetobacter radioresistens]|nr:potassium transporter TrkH [Acinetobacter radioresistens]
MHFPNFRHLTQRTINLSPPTLLALGFLSFILVGTLLLRLPISHHGHLSWMDALFTATSAVTITGLSTISVHDSLTGFGQTVLLLLIQSGGLGFMTFAIFAALSLSPTFRLRQQMMAHTATGQTNLSKVTFIAKGVFFYTLFFELIGTVILTVLFTPEYGFPTSLHYAIFYSISSLVNAGFSIFGDSLMSFEGQYLVYLVISLLYIIGGIGFIVLMDIKRSKSWSKLSANSKLVLSSIAIINLLAFIVIWMLEATNYQTFGQLNLGEQAVHAWFQATAPRSSGLNTIDTGSMTSTSTLVVMLLMFIGGGSLSTAGGIKVSTFVVLLLSVISFLRRNEEVRTFNHSISQETTVKALAVAMITCILIFGGFFLILLLEPRQNFLDLLFEIVSAACTVGLSRGITGELSSGSLMILIFLMYAGRLGPLTLAYLIATPKKSRLKHPPTDIQIG